MSYTVVWSPKTEQSLASIWMNSSNRPAITEAAEHIDRELQNRPLDVGESRESGRRIFFSSPLAVVYSIRSEQRQVRVLRL